MQKKKASVLILVTTILILIIAGVSMYFLVSRFQSVHRTYAYSEEAFGNPLMGYAPSAWHEDISDDVTLLYMDITWRELEPEEGVFDWESIEAENQLNRWRAEGKHIVLRFLCDFPDDEPHMDIPDWLYEKIDGAGTHYDTSYGCGFSPDYNNETFIAYHQKAVAALGERYGQDTFISYVELGSLGHWGEWHTLYSAGIDRMPAQSVRAQYVQHWIQAFPQAKILMRRPFAEAADYPIGLYNDMAGEPESTAEWLDWIENGGVYNETGEEDALVPMPDAWRSAPIGGEFTSSLSMAQMLDTDLEDTLSLLQDSHTTFLGPKIADTHYAQGYDRVLMQMGYRIWISEMTLTPTLTDGIQMDLCWQNSGVAPLYGDWPVYLQVLDEKGQLLEQVPVAISLSELFPGESLRTTTLLHQIDQWDHLDQYTLQLVIMDPMTQAASVRFANENAGPEDTALVLWKAL